MSTTNFLLKKNCITIVRVQNMTKSLILQHKLIYIDNELNRKTKVN